MLLQLPLKPPFWLVVGPSNISVELLKSGLATLVVYQSIRPASSNLVLLHIRQAEKSALKDAAHVPSFILFQQLKPEEPWVVEKSIRVCIPVFLHL